jgi:ribose transport system substrate-binding protein
MDRKYAKLFAGAAAVALAISSVGSAVAQDESAAPEAAAGDGYVLGVSNTVQGNGWREEMICSIKAQALASGEVASLNIAHRNTDPAGQLEDLRNLIAAGVDAIIMNPADPEALNAAVKEATDAGIPVITVDATVTEPSSYIMTNDQETYAYLGAKWLFEQMGGKGAVFYMRGLAGHSADDARDVGFQKALAEFPDVTVAKEVFTGWQQDEGKQQMLDMIASGIPFDGVWTSGIDNVIVDAMVEEGVFKPIVGADNSQFVQYLGTVEGLQGAAVTNPGSVGGAGVTLALQILNGELPAVPADEASRMVTVAPVLWENVTPEGLEAVRAAADPDLDNEWPVGISIPDWTTYDKAQIIACKGPGE